MERKNIIVTCWIEDAERLTYPIETTLAAFGPTAQIGTGAWWVQTEQPIRAVRHALAIDPGPFRHLGGPEDDFYMVDLAEGSIDSWHDGRNTLAAIADDWRKVFTDKIGRDNVTPFKPKPR